MITVVRQPKLVGDKYEFVEVGVKDIHVDKYAVMAIDGSTTNTGISILGFADNQVLYSLSLAREKNDENPVRYKVRLKKLVTEILLNNRLIETVLYEEPVVHYMGSVKNLFMLRTFVQELIIENEPDLDYIKHYEVSNQTWKKQFLDSEKIPSGTDKQKEAVRNKLVSLIPFMSVVTQDEIDAACLAAVAARNIRVYGSASELQTKTKPRPFKFNAVFISANTDDEMLEDLFEVYNGPQKLLENGVCFTEIDGRTNFDNHVYKCLQHDDKVLIVKFKSTQHGDVQLKYRVGYLAETYDYMYAVVWRQTRKS